MPSSCHISPVVFDDLKSFFQSFNFSQDSIHIQQYISLIQEASLCYQNIVHKLVDTDTIIGFIALSTTKEVDNIAGVLIEFLYLKPNFRNTIELHSQIKYSYILLDYVVTTALIIQKQIAINHIYLVPINDKVRKIYKEYGFENLPASGKNEYEDYMVFNLLDEDPTIF